MGNNLLKTWKFRRKNAHKNVNKHFLHIFYLFFIFFLSSQSTAKVNRNGESEHCTYTLGTVFCVAIYLIYRQLKLDVIKLIFYRNEEIYELFLIEKETSKMKCLMMKKLARKWEFFIICLRDHHFSRKINFKMLLLLKDCWESFVTT